ncbi:BREX-1 system adenine-specific DNA-methyltransferase PglX [Williamsia maris]|uniref:site-specific DNA-methyltransferase (adenine-specific) n=1 Tax=Williamsia maris TaxID=72806 RepID=A0ABT1H954_9NOCA|nr:BREX-1 system adenine-specific DNA-methyltransferase PglX [Williamsia maris]MCP2174787.1 Methyltransferase domain-containing protein [Williamsia maris]
METAPLKSFATAARSELIREVGARIAAVSAQGSPERVEQPRAVTALERAIAGAGGGDKGKAHVADKVAYTWFNRIIALRFMDANGYTGIGIVSPAADQVGQPEVLAAAKRGQLDTDVVKGANVATVTGLLNGSRQPRRGVDAQAEAYALLLADYCRFWNAAMPFMFEREGDYTELLIPANLLADDSVLSRSVMVLTEDVCKDVEVIGWLYQFYISERKDEVFAGFKKNKKAGADEIPAATQLFTPHWIVRYLVENSLGRLWMLNRPTSGLASQMDYYIAPVDEETGFLKVSKPEEVTVIDPACGSGHMLTYAFDLLYAIYEEEGYAPSEIPGLILTNNLYGTEIDPRAGALAAFALTMKAVAKRKLFLKNSVRPKICVLDPISFSADELSYLVTKDGDRYAEEAFWNQFAEAETFGSLVRPDPALVARLANHLDSLDDGGDIFKSDAMEWAQKTIRQAKFLTLRYSLVVANPPYMGSGSMGVRLSEFAKTCYPASKSDLFAMFIERSVDLVSNRGLVAMVTMQSWMFLSGFEKFRRGLIHNNRLASMAHLGTGAFDTLAGEVVSTTAFVIDKAARGSGHYVRLVDAGNSASKSSVLADPSSRADVSFVRDSNYFENIPGASIIYWFSDELGAMFLTHPSITSSYSPMNGMTTGSNGTFVRYWFEVARSRTCLNADSEKSAAATGARWFPYNKGGGGARRWYGNMEFVLDWEDSGRRISDYGHAFLRGRRNYFKPMITWSKINTGRPGFRYIPAGFLFDVAGMGLFSNHAVTEADFRRLLGYLNSSVAVKLLSGLSPTLNVESGQVGALPLPDLGSIDDGVVAKLVAIQEHEWNSRELSWAFDAPALLVDEHNGSLRQRLAGVIQRTETSRARLRALEAENEARVSSLLGFSVETTAGADDQLSTLAPESIIADLVSYAVGCMFGRYSLDEPGLVLADQGATLQDYLAKVPTPAFVPDADNVIPIVDGDWFEDDIVGLFRRFLRTTFGDEYFEENLKFVTESLGVKNLRDYFVTRSGKSKFYDDHVQRYRKRPIYWLFSSPKGSFNGLIYMHRYTPSTVSAVLTYLRAYVTKLESSLQQADRAGNAKEADRLRKILVELNEYEHDTLYPKASENLVIDLDDGVKTNYPKFGAALKRITGLESTSD